MITYTPAEERRAATEASRFLADFNYSSVNEKQAVKEYQHAEDASIRSAAPGEQQPRSTGDDLVLSAVGRVVWQQLEKQLAADGFERPTDAVIFSQTWKCE